MLQFQYCGKPTSDVVSLTFHLRLFCCISLNTSSPRRGFVRPPGKYLYAKQVFLLSFFWRVRVTVLLHGGLSMRGLMIVVRLSRFSSPRPVFRFVENQELLKVMDVLSFALADALLAIKSFQNVWLAGVLPHGLLLVLFSRGLVFTVFLLMLFENEVLM